MSIDKEIVKEFVAESKNLIHLLITLLENIEGNFASVRKLSEYGNAVDRIMGGAKSLALIAPEDHAMHLIADYTSLCKAVGYKASQIHTNEHLFDVCVALLLDATENLDSLIDHIDEPMDVLKKKIPSAFIERLKLISEQFSADVSQSVGANHMKQSEIDTLMKKLGL